MESIRLKITELVAAAFMWILIYLDDIKDMIVTVVTTMIVCLIITRFFFMPVRVKGTSMYPTLYNGSIGFSSIISRRVSGIERFDIVIIYVEEKDENLVKRVIGMPGETISYNKGTLYIDGDPIEEYFLDDEYVKQQVELSYHDYFTDDFTYTLADDEYYCLGDNRLVSSDSRFYGPFNSKDIISKDIFIIYPFEKFGLAE